MLLPWHLIMVVLGKREAKILFEPIIRAWRFVWEAKATAWLILLNVIAFILIQIGSITGIITDSFTTSYLLDGPSQLLSFNIIAFVANWFVHFSIGHLMGNMMFLFILGRIVEKEFGPGKMLFIYFLSAVISGIADDVFHLTSMDYFANGASGAISGLSSAAMLASPFAFTYLVLGIPIPIFLIAWSFLASDITGVLASSQGVANMAHLGGFFAILIIAKFLTPRDRNRLWKGFLLNLGTLVVLLALYLLFIH